MNLLSLLSLNHLFYWSHNSIALCSYGSLFKVNKGNSFSLRPTQPPILYKPVNKDWSKTRWMRLYRKGRVSQSQRKENERRRRRQLQSSKWMNSRTRRKERDSFSFTFIPCPEEVKLFEEEPWRENERKICSWTCPFFYSVIDIPWQEVK